jgi:hypothetical protein
VTDFYGRFGSVSLTLLGLWVIVVQTRYEAWAGSLRHRRQATAVALIFGLPGSMSFLSLVDPTRPLVWRASFVVGGAVGATGVLAVVVDRTLRPSDPRATIGLWTGGLLHSAIALIALVAGPLGRSRFGLTPLETEALLFSLVLSAGLAVAWLLLFADDDRATPADRRRPHLGGALGHVGDSPAGGDPTATTSPAALLCVTVIVYAPHPTQRAPHRARRGPIRSATAVAADPASQGPAGEVSSSSVSCSRGRALPMTRQRGSGGR